RREEVGEKLPATGRGRAQRNQWDGRQQRTRVASESAEHLNTKTNNLQRKPGVARLKSRGRSAANHSHLDVRDLHPQVALAVPDLLVIPLAPPVFLDVDLDALFLADDVGDDGRLGDGGQTDLRLA